MEIINELNAIPLGFLTGLFVAFFVVVPLLNRWLDSIDKPKCKFCNCSKLESFAGIGADGVSCKGCGKIQ